MRMTHNKVLRPSASAHAHAPIGSLKIARRRRSDSGLVTVTAGRDIAPRICIEAKRQQDSMTGGIVERLTESPDLDKGEAS